MKMHIYAEGARRGASHYLIAPADKDNAQDPRPEVADRMVELLPRIEAMARKQLGDSFLSLEHVGGELLLLDVKVGTAKEKRFELRDLFGWINLFDEE